MSGQTEADRAFRGCSADAVELSFAQQSAAFLWSVLLGASLGAFYGILRFARFAFRLGRAATFALDVVFMLVSSVVLFLFALGFVWGYVRVYILAGTVFGFSVWRLTAGRLFFRVYRPVVNICRKILNYFLRKLKKSAKNLLKIGRKILYNVRVKKSESHNLDDKGNENGIDEEKARCQAGTGKGRGCFRGKGSQGGHARQET